MLALGRRRGTMKEEHRSHPSQRRGASHAFAIVPIVTGKVLVSGSMLHAPATGWDYAMLHRAGAACHLGETLEPSSEEKCVGQWLERWIRERIA